MAQGDACILKYNVKNKEALLIVSIVCSVSANHMEIDIKLYKLQQIFILGYLIYFHLERNLQLTGTWSN